MVRMKDIANDLGVSVMTVLRALRNYPDVSAATRAEVLQRAKELNYRPNLAARALVTGRTGLMGLVIPNLVHSFFAQLAVELSGVLRNHSFRLVISSSAEDPEVEQQEIDHLLSRGVDALLVASTQPTPEAFRRLEATKVPYVLLGRWFPGLAANFVGVSDEAVGSIATRHLLEIGCRHTAYIGGTQAGPALGQLEGYKRTLTSHGIPVTRKYIVSVDECAMSASDAGYQAAVRVINLDPCPNGIFCCSDSVAIGAMTAILDAGLRIPEDIALIGCGNLPFNSSLRVPLSSIDQRSGAIGRRAAELAVSLVRVDVRLRPKAILLEPTLVIRRSTTRRNSRRRQHPLKPGGALPEVDGNHARGAGN
jgi:LacI family transcriptional regulator